MGVKPIQQLKWDGKVVDILVSERRFPRMAESVIVPVAPNLKMSYGIAKWVRDATAGKFQIEAERAAPLAPGDAFAGSGGKYRFQHAIVAVVMDETKRYTAEWIEKSVQSALRLAAERHAHSCLVADMTDDLMRQPQWLSLEERKAICKPVAMAILQGVRKAATSPEEVAIWVWRSDYKDIWMEALSSLE